ncbi:PTS fructose transporter subunit IIC [Vibrio litoralis]|uniref:PTS fructose transporter subunit IIC n=1 Tax=Vibrio litoralis TaxID=335972 RepID=UPI001868814E|nr:fructose-specific PTS transporter subunit EIIC [Vibrio litoralis]
MNIIAITSCPTGVAHTYIAEKNLIKAANSLNLDLLVETQGALDANYILSETDIKNADIVLIAADKYVDMTRFNGKKIIKVSISEAAKKANELLTKITSGELKPITCNIESSTTDSGNTSNSKNRISSEIYTHLMSGVQLMIPFVVAGGILIALSFAFGIHAANVNDPTYNPLAKILSVIGGGSAFALMLPILALGISQSIAGKSGITAGAVGGMMAIETGSGFIGALIAGFIAGYVTVFVMKNIKLPQLLAGLKPILLTPLISVFVTGLLMYVVIGEPIKAVLDAVTVFLTGLTGVNAGLLGLIFGIMVAIDMGGPLNKTACLVAIGLMSTNVFGPIAACMAAGMTPPLGIALATTLFKDRFTQEERETGKVTYFLGLSFITEGAIPYAATDPLRVIPAIVAGSGLAGALSMLFGVESRAPHGGIFVMLIPNVITNLLMYFVAIALGALLTAVILRLVKKKQTPSLA